MGSEQLNFTLEIWDVDVTSEVIKIFTNNKRISVKNSPKFPFLDINLECKKLKSEGKIKWNYGGISDLVF